MTPERLQFAALFAAAVIVTLIGVRMAGVLTYNRIAHRFHSWRGGAEPTSLRQGLLIGWCGMRGLVTLATAFALPGAFPQRDLVVLTAFAVVLATLVVQGLTLAPLVRLLKLDGPDGLPEELADLRADLAAVALKSLDGKSGAAADHWRFRFEDDLAALADKDPADSPESRRLLGLAAIRSKRVRLEELRDQRRVGADAFMTLQEELDFEEVALSADDERHIEEV